MGYRIKERICLVTGANRGIGLAIVESLLRHGAAKIYTGVRTLERADRLVSRYGEKVLPLIIDYNDPATIEAAAETALDAQVVISNAGILKQAQVFDQNAIDIFKEELEINVYGLIRMARAFAPVLKANGGGAFVQINSIASLANFDEFSTYCASKAAAYSFTQALRAPFAAQGTALLSVHPGPIETEMAASAGMAGMGDPPEVVAEGIVNALQAGDFLLFPDEMAGNFKTAYHSFAEGVISAAE